MESEKSEVRKSVRARLMHELEVGGHREKASEEICGRILDLPEFASAHNVFAFMALSDEVDLSPVISQAIKCGKKVAVPKVTDLHGEMDFFWISGDSCFFSGAFEIREPDESAEKVCIQNLYGETLVLIPGVAFTSQGNRLGRGRGFYDRYLEKLKCAHKNTFLAGVCFSCQILSELPSCEHDVLMDCVISN